MANHSYIPKCQNAASSSILSSNKKDNDSSKYLAFLYYMIILFHFLSVSQIERLKYFSRIKFKKTIKFSCEMCYSEMHCMLVSCYRRKLIRILANLWWIFDKLMQILQTACIRNNFCVTPPSGRVDQLKQNKIGLLNCNVGTKANKYGSYHIYYIYL